MSKSLVDQICQQIELFLHYYMGYNLFNILLSLKNLFTILLIRVIKEFTLFVAIEDLVILQAFQSQLIFVRKFLEALRRHINVKLLYNLLHLLPNFLLMFNFFFINIDMALEKVRLLFTFPKFV